MASGQYEHIDIMNIQAFFIAGFENGALYIKIQWGLGYPVPLWDGAGQSGRQHPKIPFPFRPLSV